MCVRQRLLFQWLQHQAEEATLRSPLAPGGQTAAADESTAASTTSPPDHVVAATPSNSDYNGGQTPNEGDVSTATTATTGSNTGNQSGVSDGDVGTVIEAIIEEGDIISVGKHSRNDKLLTIAGNFVR